MKILLIILGALSLVLGVVGIALPLLPTTPFLLLAAALFAHSSPRLHEWLLSHRVFGSYIRNYIENRSLPLTFKIATIATLWITIAVSIYLSPIEGAWIDVLLLLIAVAVTWHIVRLGRKR